jgi:hypothetical protein
MSLVLTFSFSAGIDFAILIVDYLEHSQLRCQLRDTSRNPDYPEVSGHNLV